VSNEQRGADIVGLEGVEAITDVTGLALGHLLEICGGRGVNARVRYADVPTLEPVARSR
jgi:selenide,water dikinase